MDGNVELRRFTQAGQRIVIHRVKGGEIFAEASLFSKRYHCEAVITKKSNLVELDRTIILKKFHDEPDFALTHEVVYRGLAKPVAKGMPVKTGRGQYSAG